MESVYVLTSVFDAQISTTVYSSENQKLAETEFLAIFTEELKSCGLDPREINLEESFNDSIDGEQIYYVPYSAFSFIDSGYDVVLEKCNVE